MKKRPLIILLICIVGVVGYFALSKYGCLNNCFNNPKCEHDCWENGVRVR